MLLAWLSGLLCSSSLPRSQLQEHKLPQFAAGAWGEIPFQAQSKKMEFENPRSCKKSPEFRFQWQRSVGFGTLSFLSFFLWRGRAGAVFEGEQELQDLGFSWRSLGAELGPRHHLPPVHGKGGWEKVWKRKCEGCCGAEDEAGQLCSASVIKDNNATSSFSPECPEL